MIEVVKVAAAISILSHLNLHLIHSSRILTACARCGWPGPGPGPGLIVGQSNAKV